MKRDYLMDNLKGLLIFTVVFGHLLSGTGVIDDRFGQLLWVLVYSFHIPGLLFVSGYLSKKQIEHPNYRGLTTLLVYYIFGCSGIYFAQSLIEQKLSIGTFLTPAFAMWYFLSLATYRLLLPWLAGIKYILPVSFLLSVLVGTVVKIGTFLAISRTVSFLPFFLLGALSATPERMKQLRGLPVHTKALGIIILSLCYLNLVRIMYKLEFNRAILWMRSSYEAAGLSELTGMISRIYILVTAVVFILVLIVFLPDRETYISRWGKNSLSVYILHAWLYVLIEELFRHYELRTALPVWARFISAIALSYILVQGLSFDRINQTIKKAARAITDRLTL